MAINLTDPEGMAHIDERQASPFTGVTNPFDAIEFGQGNDVPSTTANRTWLTNKIAGSLRQVATDYPLKNDGDVRNDGRGTDVWTWLFVVPEGTALAASNFIVTNFDGGGPLTTEPVMVTVDDHVFKRADQVAYVWVNVSTTYAPTVVVHIEEGAPVPEQSVGWRAESLLMSGSPGGHTVLGSKVQSRLSDGDAVWTAARLLNDDGGLLARDDVRNIRLQVLVREGESRWRLHHERHIDVYTVIPSAPVRTDPKWRPTQGYTFAHQWRPDPAWGARKTRLEYIFRLASGGERALVHEVEYRAVRGL